MGILRTHRDGCVWWRGWLSGGGVGRGPAGGRAMGGGPVAMCQFLTYTACAGVGEGGGVMAGLHGACEVGGRERGGRSAHSRMEADDRENPHWRRAALEAAARTTPSPHAQAASPLHSPPPPSSTDCCSPPVRHGARCPPLPFPLVAAEARLAAPRGGGDGGPHVEGHVRRWGAAAVVVRGVATVRGGSCRGASAAAGRRVKGGGGAVARPPPPWGPASPDEHRPPPPGPCPSSPLTKTARGPRSSCPDAAAAGHT